MNISIGNELIDNRTLIKKRQVKLIKLYFISIFVTLIQQFPLIRDYWYEEIRLLLYFLFAVLYILLIKNFLACKKPLFIKYFYIIVMSTGFIFLFFQIIGWNVSIFHLREMVIPLLFISVAYSIPISDKDFNVFLRIYSYLAILLGIFLILYYGTGFVIQERYIRGAAKNQTGPIIAAACLVLFYNEIFTSTSSIKTKLRITSFLFFLTGIFSLSILRNRAGLLGILLICSFIISNKIFINKKSLNKLTIAFLLFSIFVISVIIGLFDPIFDLLYQSFTLGRDVYDLDDLSARRWNVYLEAIKYINDNPLFGQLNTGISFYRTPHNYLINKLVQYGMLGSLFLIVFYFYIFIFVINNILHKREHLALWLMLFAIVISMFEYSQPYGPGVSQIIVWLTMGQYLKKRYYSIKTNNVFYH